jgi:hypothetical protein
MSKMDFPPKALKTNNPLAAGWRQGGELFPANYQFMILLPLV